MAKIYELELKGIKNIENNGIIANLYYRNKKIAIYTDTNNDFIPTVTFDNKIKDTLIDEVIDKIKLYYVNNPKEFYFKNKDCLIIEFIEELYRLKELEDIFKKLNKKTDTILIELRFSSRTSYISDFNKEDMCISTTLWSEEFKEKLFQKYNPVEYTLFTSFDDFVVII